MKVVNKMDREQNQGEDQDQVINPSKRQRQEHGPQRCTRTTKRAPTGKPFHYLVHYLVLRLTRGNLALSLPLSLPRSLPHSLPRFTSF